MKKVAIYARKSVEVQDSVSIETQVTMCKNYFADEQCEFEVFKDDGYSGGNTNRPAFKLLRKKVELEMFNTLVCYKLDRISRKVLDMADFFELLENHNTALICVKDKYDTSTPMGRAMIYFASVFAQLERETIAERVKDSMFQLAKKGCWTGGRSPYGYKTIKKNGKSYLELENEEFIKDCFNYYSESWSFYNVAKKLKNKYGYPDTKETVRRILTSPIYVKSDELVSSFFKKKGYEVIGEPNGCGYLPYGVHSGYSTIIVSSHKALITSFMWLQIQKKINKKHEIAINKESKAHWLSNIFRCPYCGGNYILKITNGRSYYACKNRVKHHKCENNKYTRTEKLESAIEKYLSSFKDKKQFEKIYIDSHIDRIPSNVNKLKIEIDKNNKVINNLMDKVGLLNNDAAALLIEKLNVLSEKNKSLKEKLENEKLNVLEMENKKFDKEFVYENICDFQNAESAEEKQNHVRNIFESIVYDPFKDTFKIFFL